MAPVHRSPFAGSWYPGQRGELEQLLDQAFETSRQRTGPCLLPGAFGFVVPHAGIMYSGTVAAAAYRHLQEQPPDRVVLLGFSHNGGPAGVSVPDVAAITTPLGEVAVDRSAVERLAAQAPFQLVEEEWVCDHSVEIQLPLLQRAAPGVPVVPLYTGLMGDDERAQAAAALAALAPGSVFIASSDFTHYGQSFGYEPFPCDRRVEAHLNALDQQVIEAISSLETGLFLEELAETGSTVCGRDPIALWLRTLAFLNGEAIFQNTLDYQTSGEITDDFRHSVSYAALGYFPVRSWRLETEDRALLAASARQTLERLRATGRAVPVPPTSVTPALRRRAGVFVSLHQHGQLLGCVGAREGRESLARDVPDMTLAAALDDPRFDSILGVEGEIELEISVLTPLKRIADIARFCPGRHGAWMKCGVHAALLLPQVGVERGWGAQEFFAALSAKAGLGPQAYLESKARLSVFEAEVFSDTVQRAAAG